MKRIIGLISAVAIFFSLATNARGETVSQKQAQNYAQQFFNEAAGRVMAPCKLVYNGRRLTTDRLFVPFYVYNQPKGGFVIISAENKAFPILGFSLKDNFDPDRLGDTETELLKSYAMEIEYVRYDSQVPEEAVRAWSDYPKYVSEILKARYDATDPIFSIDEADQMVAVALDNDLAVFSDIYTPEQWRDMIDDELRLNKSVPVWLVGKNAIYPMIVYGRQGDYFRLEMSRRNSWLMRLNATELIPSNMLSVINYPILLNDDLEVETPFADYDLFAREAADIESRRLISPGPDLSLIEDKPLVRSHGSGHFEIISPKQIATVRVYNLSGALLNTRTYGDSDRAFVDLVAEPQGFYFVNVVSEDGTPYGIKIYR